MDEYVVSFFLNGNFCKKVFRDTKECREFIKTLERSGVHKEVIRVHKRVNSKGVCFFVGEVHYRKFC